MIPLTLQIPACVIKYLPARLARKRTGKLPAVVPSASGESRDLQLLVDVSVIQQSDARTGIQRVVRALLWQLLQNPPKGYRICPIYATRHQGYRYVAPKFFGKLTQKNTPVEETPVVVQRGDIFLALDLAAHLIPRHESQILRWKREGVQLHVLVYDLLPLLHPEWFNTRTTRNFDRWIRWLAIYADSAICISQTVKIELHTWLKARFDLPSTALTANTIILGADIKASMPSSGLPASAKAMLEHMRETACVLMVGTLEPRKGHDEVLAAFEQLWEHLDRAPSLIIVGRAGWKTEDLQEKLRAHPEANQRLFWLDSVTDEYLTSLYVACRGVLVASRAEGFGLPLIEAASHGKPVLARDIPIFREIKIPKLSYFGNIGPKGLADRLNHWLVSTDVVSPETVSDFELPTWQLSATQLVCALGLALPTESNLHSVVPAADPEKSSSSVFKSAISVS